MMNNAFMASADLYRTLSQQVTDEHNRLQKERADAQEALDRLNQFQAHMNARILEEANKLEAWLVECTKQMAKTVFDTAQVQQERVAELIAEQVFFQQMRIQSIDQQIKGVTLEGLGDAGSEAA